MSTAPHINGGATSPSKRSKSDNDNGTSGEGATTSSTSTGDVVLRGLTPMEKETSDTRVLGMRALYPPRAFLVLLTSIQLKPQPTTTSTHH